MTASADAGADGRGEVAGTAGRVARVRLPMVALIVPAVTLFCVLPLATAGGPWAAAFVLPVAMLVLMLVAGTTATAAHVSTLWWTGRRRVAWGQVDRIEFPSSRWAVAVTHAGERVVLPGVRPQDLPRIAAAAGGRLFLQRTATAGAPAGSGTGGDTVAGGSVSSAGSSLVGADAVVDPAQPASSVTAEIASGGIGTDRA